ncbi:MAG TPA: response regulator [Planctomycetota bacterium]|nr:response regulator [Planctomycetota bacterium]
MAKILVLDDESQWLELVRDKLLAMGHEVRTTADCLDALRQIEADLPDLAIIDLRMPVSGSTMLRAMREDWPELPVVMHTVYSGYRDAPSLNGIAGFAVKNPELTELIKVVENVLAQKQRCAETSST